MSVLVNGAACQSTSANRRAHPDTRAEAKQFGFHPTPLRSFDGKHSGPDLSTVADRERARPTQKPGWKAVSRGSGAPSSTGDGGGGYPLRPETTGRDARRHRSNSLQRSRDRRGHRPRRGGG